MIRKELFIILLDIKTYVKLFLVKLNCHHSLISHPNNESEMTQIACRIVEAYDGHINFFRLVKLLYIVEHESWNKLDQPAMGGEYFSLEGGPMISETANATKPKYSEKFQFWAAHLKTTEYKKAGDVKGSEISLVKSAGRDEIPDALLKIVDDVISQTQGWKNKQIEDYVHDVKKFAEYKKPSPGGRLPIEAEEILGGFGKSPEKIKKIQAESEQWRMFEAALA